MKIMPCPLNGPRNISEFTCFGEVTDMPDPNRADDAAWAEHVWFANNTAGVVREWWCHMPTNYWFIAERHTVSDEIVRTYPVTEVFNRRIDFAAKDGGA
jgi:sarcosine oxidase subunit delta